MSVPQLSIMDQASSYTMGMQLLEIESVNVVFKNQTCQFIALMQYIDHDCQLGTSLLL